MTARTGFVLLLAFALAGCDRRASLIPASRDSTGTAKPDSFQVAAARATQAWEAGQSDDAAGATAEVVRAALRARPNGPWPERTRGVLDSLAIGSEVAGSDRAIVVNLFSRGDAQDQTWPYVFWHDGKEVRSQRIDPPGMRLQDATTRGFDDRGSPRDSSQLAVLWSRRAGPGPQPVLTLWRWASGGRWDLLQTLGPDSLGGTGSAEFARSDSGPVITAHTFRGTPWFEECTTCPHVFHERRFVWGPQGFRRLDERLVPSPYTTFTALIAALVSGDRDRALPYVADPALVEFARRYEWNVTSKGRWRVAPATDESALEMVFFRGDSDAFRVTFQQRGSEWVVLGFEAVPRTLE